MVQDVAVDRKLVKWGTGYGIRLTTKEVDLLGLKPGDFVHADVRRPAIKNDFSVFDKFNFGPWPKDKTVQDLIDDDIDERYGLGKYAKKPTGGAKRAGR